MQSASTIKPPFRTPALKTRPINMSAQEELSFELGFCGNKGQFYNRCLFFAVYALSNLYNHRFEIRIFISLYFHNDSLISVVLKGSYSMSKGAALSAGPSGSPGSAPTIPPNKFTKVFFLIISIADDHFSFDVLFSF